MHFAVKKTLDNLITVCKMAIKKICIDTLKNCQLSF